jgi:hypothetical protein
MTPHLAQQKIKDATAQLYEIYLWAIETGGDPNGQSEVSFETRMQLSRGLDSLKRLVGTLGDTTR